MTQNPLDLEIRHIRTSNLAQLSAIIDKTKAWKELLDKLSKPLGLTLESIHLIEQQYHCGKSPTLALLNHWSITGRRRPTIMTLIHYLRMCNLKWAEDYVWREILKCNELQIAPTVQAGIAEPKEQADTRPSISYMREEEEEEEEKKGEEFVMEDEYRFKDLKEVVSRLQQDCLRYSFKDIYSSTNRFCHRPFDPRTRSGPRIGDGRFSSVFLAKSHIEQPAGHQEHQTVAAKLLKSECKLSYLVNEINLAMKIKHENILELLGISVGVHNEQPTFMCLVYPYMENGSLFDCLSSGLRCNNNERISWMKRFEMATKIARGISYLHTFNGGSIIHRDVKTANILVDRRLDPKLGDFTLVRQLDSMRNGETQYSQNVIGTSVYMPPEAFRGDISTKFDIFSFGIVLFELLSGRRPFDEDLSEDLLTYVSENLSDIDDKIVEQAAPEGQDITHLRNQFLLSFLDKQAGEWSEFSVAKVMFDAALRATEVRKRDRPEMSIIVDLLEGKLLADRKIDISLRED